MSLATASGLSELSISDESVSTTFNIIEGDKLQSYLDTIEREGGEEGVDAADVTMEEPEV